MRERLIVPRKLTKEQIEKALQAARENGRKAEEAMKRALEIRGKK